jgi:hypothetical protein
LKVYANGTVAAATYSGTIPALTSSNGANVVFAPTDSGRFTGTGDEFRISSIARSAAWIATEYNNQSGAFFTVGAEENSGAAASR